MLEMVQKGVRGGISVISRRFAKANNKSSPTMELFYDASKPTSFILHLDANNLYGFSMSQHLPTGNYRFDCEDVEDFDISWDEIEQVITPESNTYENRLAILSTQKYTESFIQKWKDDDDTGGILEVDIDIPNKIHKYLNDYPPCPETTSFEPSPAMKSLFEFLNGTDKKITQTNKLIPNLENKKNYVCHYRNLKLYLQMGCVLKKVHRVLLFHQAPILKSYIDFNTKIRASAKTDSEKELPKLNNNSIFGKTLENVEKRKNIKLTTSEKEFLKLSAKPTFQDCRLFPNNLIAVENQKTFIKYDRPLIVGMSILELSKCLMYDFHYNIMKKKYKDKIHLLMTDTDSFVYHIETEDIYKDMKEIYDTTYEYEDKNYPLFTKVFDTSDYPENHPMHSKENKKKIGKFKDESNGRPILEFCGVRSKMYSILKEDNIFEVDVLKLKKEMEAEGYYDEDDELETPKFYDKDGKLIYDENGNLKQKQFPQHPELVKIMKQNVKQAKQEWEQYMMKSDDKLDENTTFWKDGNEYVGQQSILKTKSVAKGIKSSEIKKLTHKNYYDALFGTTKEEKSQSVSANFIRHENHQLYSQTITKTGICGFDDKRFVESDNIHTLAHGHCEIAGFVKRHAKEEQKKKDAEKLKILEEKLNKEQVEPTETKATEEEKIPDDKCDKCGKEDVLIDDENKDAFSVLNVCEEKLLCDECI
jgi:hypothetical protein